MAGERHQGERHLYDSLSGEVRFEAEIAAA